MIIPPLYASRRNLARAYRRGFHAGTVAGLGGVPLAPYLKSQMVQAFRQGFEAGQAAKDQPASPRPNDMVDAASYTFSVLFSRQVLMLQGEAVTRSDGRVYELQGDVIGKELVSPRYGCKQCHRDFSHEPDKFTLSGVPARTYFFCSIPCRVAFQVSYRDQ